MNLTWYKNGCGGEVDPLVSEASCSPSATQVSEKIGHVLEGAHFLRLWGRGWSKEGVCKSEALSLVLTILQTATSSSSPRGVLC